MPRCEKEWEKDGYNRILVWLYSIAPIAQLVEQVPLKDKVVGSIPTGRTTKYKKLLLILSNFVLVVRAGARRCEAGSQVLLTSKTCDHIV